MKTTKQKSKMKKILILLVTVLFAVTQLSGMLSVQAASTTYTGWTERSSATGSIFYLKEQGTDNTEIAYCYDPSDTSPPKEGFPYRESGVITDETIRGLIYSGYPTNGSGLMEIFGLTEVRFRYITQQALWLLRGGNDIRRKLSTNELYCYNLLCGVITSVNYNGSTVTLADIPSNFVVTLYSNGYYQRLIKATFLEEPKTPETYPVYFSKRDADGNELAGAAVQLQADDGTVIESWLSDGSVHTFEVTTGSYKLVETAAPEGYLLAAEISFTVDAGGNITCGKAVVTSDAPIVMVDDLSTIPNNSDTPIPNDDDSQTPNSDTTTPSDESTAPNTDASPKTGQDIGSLLVQIACMVLSLTAIAILKKSMSKL